MIGRLVRHIRWRWQMLRRIYWPQFYLAQFLPGVVQSGPFTGMKYGRLATGSVVLPKLTGTYECELHPVLASWNLDQYDVCIDVGAGEGYYAVGVCHCNPGIQMIAYEQSFWGRNRIRRLARRNGVLARVNIKGRCEPEYLQESLLQGKRVLLIMDVEGYEAVLMDPERVPALKNVDFIVEMHPERIGPMDSVLYQRFENSHHLVRIPRQIHKSIPAGVRLPGRLEKNKEFLVDEFRGPQYWLAGKSIQYTAH